MAPPAPPPPPPPPIQGADTGVAAATPMTQPAVSQEFGLDGGQNSGAGPMDPAGTNQGEKSMTLADVRKQSCNWSMASDAGLLLYLQEFSHKMIARTSELEKMVDGLVNETKSTDSKVHNTFNDFLMIANTQFVENRVYDDSEEMDMQNAAQANSEKREVTEVDLIPKVSKALNLGINVIDTAFDTLDANAGNSDSEDEDVGYRHEPILEPKDPYSHRPLPHIIGSRLFMEEDDVGLVDYISEAEDDLSATGSSVSESEEESDLSESDYSESESESDLEEGDVGDSPISDAEENDLFGVEKDSGDEFENGPQMPDFASELAAKISGADPKDQRRERSASKISTSSGKDKKKKESEKKEKRRRRISTKSSTKTEDDDPFGVQSPPDDDDTGAFSGGGLFSGGKGLFDDAVVDDDDGGLFDDEPSKIKETLPKEEETKPKEPKPRARTRSGRKVPVGGVAMFGAVNDELFGSPPKDAGKEVEEEDMEGEEEDDESNRTILRAHFAAMSKRPLFVNRNKRHSQKSVDSKGAGGLFDDNDDNDDGDLFADAPAKKEPVKATTSSGLFAGDEEDELFGESNEPTPAPAPQKKKLPAGAVSMFGSIDPLAAMKGPVANTEEQPEPQKPIEPVKKPVAKQKSTGLFDDDDDLFGIPSVSSKTESPKVKRNSSKFFEDDDDGLFTVPKEEPAKQQSAASKKPATSMFDDEDDEDAGDDLFAAAAKPKETGKKKKPVGGIAIFGGEDLSSQITQKDGGKMTETEEKGSPKKHEPVPIREKPTTPRKNTFSLFYDEDEKDDEELFPSSSASSSSSSGTPLMKEKSDQNKAQRIRTKSSVFDDEDVLFGSRQEEAPQVDLFSGTSPSSPPKPDTKKSKTGGMFDDDDDDDDLFGEKTLQTEQAVKVFSSKPTSSPSQGQSKNLFADDLDDDLFGPGKSVKPQVRTKPPITGPKSRNQQLKEPSRAPPPPIRTKNVGSVSPPVVKMRPKKNDSKASSDKFADNDDEDLFGNKDKKAASPVTKSSKPVGGVSMFGAVDPLTVGKTSEMKADSQDSVSISSSVSSEQPTANGISAPTQEDSLFGSPPEDDHLFPPKSSTSRTPGFKTVKPPAIKHVKAPAKAPSNIGKIQHLSAHNRTTITLCAAPKPFYARLFGKKGKKAKNHSGTATLPKPFSKFAKSKPMHKHTKQTRRSQSRLRMPPLPSPPVHRSRRRRKSVGRRSVGKANIIIDPNKLRPGAAPVTKELEEDFITFDQPPEVNTLPNYNKNRVKVGSRRRPPSRNRREAKSNGTEPPAPTSDLSNDMDFASAYQPLPDIDTQSSETYESYESLMGSKSAYAKVQIRSKTSSDMSGVDDFLTEGRADPLSRTPPPLPDDDISVKANISKTQLIEDDPLFSASPASNSNNSSKSNHLEEDDLLRAPSRVEKPIAKPRSALNDNDSSSSSKVSEKEKKVAENDNEDDDLFGSSTKVSDKRKQIASRIDVDEGLFSSPSKIAAVKVDDRIEEDLLSSPSQSKDKPPMRVTEDELFTSPKKESKRPKSKTVRVDTDLFADSTDIFSDIPNSKSKEKKTKKKTDPLFKGVQGDDIFADTSSSKPKKTKSKKKTDRKSGGTSIFNSDAPSIFDDPLNATQRD